MGWAVGSTRTTRFAYQFNPLHCRTPYAILDDERRIVAVLAGRPYPKDGIPDSWDDVVARACAAIEAAREEMHFDEDDISHRRGPHIGKAFGWSHGHGQQVRMFEPLHCIFLTALLV
jgi:hypothetical protein